MKRAVSMTLPAALCAGLLVALAPLGTSAQTKPKKSEAAGTQKTISGGAVKGNALTFKEFEACMKEQDALKSRTPDLQKQRDALEAERKTIQAEATAIKADSEALNAFSERVKAFNARLREQGEKVNQWKARDAEFAESKPSGPTAERIRKELERDRLELQKNETTLDKEVKDMQAEREKLGIDKFNARATAQEKAAIDWNARSKTLDNAFQAYEDDRIDWKSRCADRPYREEWEKILQNERK